MTGTSAIYQTKVIMLHMAANCAFMKGKADHKSLGNSVFESFSIEKQFTRIFFFYEGNDRTVYRVKQCLFQLQI